MKFKESLKKDWYLYLLILVTYIVTFCFYSKLPAQVPSHWGINGQIDGYLPRLAGVLILPSICLGCLVLFEFLPLIDPKKYNYELFANSYQIFKVSFIVFMLILHATVILFALGFAIDVNLIVTSGVGILFMILGNYLSKIKPNYFVGFKLPWTLASDYVWKKTHRLAGGLMFICGLIFIISGIWLRNALAFVIPVVVILLIVIPTIYAYMIYQKHEKGHSR